MILIRENPSLRNLISDNAYQYADESCYSLHHDVSKTNFIGCLLRFLVGAHSARWFSAERRKIRFSISYLGLRLLHHRCIFEFCIYLLFFLQDSSPQYLYLDAFVFFPSLQLLLSCANVFSSEVLGHKMSPCPHLVVFQKLYAMKILRKEVIVSRGEVRKILIL